MENLENLQNEIWKTIPEFENYEVSNFGNVRCKHSIKKTKNIKLKPTLTKLNYYKINLKNENKKVFTKLVHRLVGIAFISNPENKPNINHINGIKTDNRVVNLEWCTQSENIYHAFRTGLKSANGEKNSRAKLSEKQVLEIKSKFKPRIVGYKTLAREYGVSDSTIREIVSKSGRSWLHLK